MESYEQQYSNLTAEITSKIGRIPNLTGSKDWIHFFWYTIFRELLTERRTRSTSRTDVDLLSGSALYMERFSFRSPWTWLLKFDRFDQTRFSSHFHGQKIWTPVTTRCVRFDEHKDPTLYYFCCFTPAWWLNRSRWSSKRHPLLYQLEDPDQDNIKFNRSNWLPNDTWLVPEYSFFLRLRCSTLTNKFSSH